jgi:hypothetical protein
MKNMAIFLVTLMGLVGCSQQSTSQTKAVGDEIVMEEVAATVDFAIWNSLSTFDGETPPSTPWGLAILEMQSADGVTASRIVVESFTKFRDQTWLCTSDLSKVSEGWIDNATDCQAIADE